MQHRHDVILAYANLKLDFINILASAFLTAAAFNQLEPQHTLRIC